MIIKWFLCNSNIIVNICFGTTYYVICFRDVYVIPVFVWVLAFAIVFALQVIQPVVALLTFAKGSLLLATVSLAWHRAEWGHLGQWSSIKNSFSNVL